MTLTGKVTLPYKAAEIAKRVAKVDGVTSVCNKIERCCQCRNSTISSVGQMARAIHSNPALSMYGHGANSSIHVIEHGRVTLDGVVNNDADRQIANQVARLSHVRTEERIWKTNAEMKMELERSLEQA